MQVHAFDGSKKISASDAKKGVDYQCLECLSVIRLRGGRCRSLHFFHKQNNRHCRQAQKGKIHLSLQKKIQSFFTNSEIEHPFPSVGRIADVACPDIKIVFEIQYSPMSVEEAQSRIRDYAALGYNVLWILHDHTFNKRKQSPVEKFLRAHLCYYSNVNEKGEGTLYDQLEGLGKRYTIDLRKRHPIPKFKWPKELQNRAKNWPYYHEGDLIDLAYKGQFQTATDRSFIKKISHAYFYFLRWILEKFS